MATPHDGLGFRIDAGRGRSRASAFPPYDPLYLHVQKVLKETGDLAHYLGSIAAGFAHIRIPEPKGILTGETRVEQLERWKKLDSNESGH